jgi:glycosyltransferase involved in cell wall biosynthesis
VVVGPKGWGDAGLAEGAAAPPGVVVAGQVPDPLLAALYPRARVFAYVPLTEGYGFPPLEAMNLGTPVVASRTVPSVAADGADPAAVLVDPRSVDAIAAGLLAASVDEPLRAGLAERGRAVAGSRSWRASALRHLEIWRSLS